MSKLSFHVYAHWDEEAKIYYSESDIDGLHIEADTLEEFEATMLILGPQMIVANHISKLDQSNLSLVDMIPSILWQTPKNHAHA